MTRHPPGRLCHPPPPPTLPPPPWPPTCTCRRKGQEPPRLICSLMSVSGVLYGRLHAGLCVFEVVSRRPSCMVMSSWLPALWPATLPASLGPLADLPGRCGLARRNLRGSSVRKLEMPFALFSRMNSFIVIITASTTTTTSTTSITTSTITATKLRLLLLLLPLLLRN